MTLASALDHLTLQELRDRRGLKWTRPDADIGAFVAEMDYGTSPDIIAALHEAVDHGRLGYLPECMSVSLKQATASRLARAHDWRVAPERVFITQDVIAGLKFAITNHCSPGGKVIVPTPAYMPFIAIPPTLGREVIEVPMVSTGGLHLFDVEAIGAAFEAGGELLVVCNPFNPLGRVFTEEELRAVAEVVVAHDGRVFADEIWAPLVFQGRHRSYADVHPEAAGHAITALSAAKAWNIPGLKCAQLVASNDADAALLAEHEQVLAHGASTLGVLANTVAYEGDDDWLSQVLEYLARNRDTLFALVEEQLPGVRVTRPEGTYAAWLDFRDTGLENPAQFFTDHARVAMTDGLACGRAGAGHARFIYAMPHPILEEAFYRMGVALRERC